MYLRSRRDGRDVLLREPYNVVTYDSSDPSLMAYVEGVPDPGLDLITGRAKVRVDPADIYDGIRVYDKPPFLTRFGSAV